MQAIFYKTLYLSIMHYSYSRRNILKWHEFPGYTGSAIQLADAVAIVLTKFPTHFLFGVYLANLIKIKQHFSKLKLFEPI